jgi:hypothetical protein
MQQRSLRSLPSFPRLALAAAVLAITLACGGSTDSSPTDDDLAASDTASPADAQGDDAVPSDLTPPPIDTVPPPRECVSGADCDDDNRCTDELCLDHVCATTFNALPCDDGDPCTADDRCTAGACTGGAMACDDANACTTDGCKNGACTHKAVAGDACALRIDVTWPARGASLEGGGPLTLTGAITSPAAPIAAATLDGVPVDFSADGAFAAPFEPAPGLNVLRLRARDGLGREADRVQSFLVGDDFLAGGTPGAPHLVPTGLDVWLRYDVFDDDDLSDLDDVATLVDRALAGLDLEAEIPHPLTAEGEGPSFAWCTWTIDITDVAYDVDHVDLFPQDGALWLSITLTNFSAYVDAIDDTWFCPNANGWVFADVIGIDAEVQVAVNAGGAISTSAPYVAATVQGIELALDGGVVSLFDWLLNWFSDSFARKIEGAVETWVPESLVPILNGVLGDVATYTKSLALPAVPDNAPGAALTAAVQAREVTITETGVRLGTRAGAEVAVAPPHASPGSLLRGHCLGSDPGAFWLPGWDQVEVAVTEDLLNRALWALWAGRHLSVTLDETLLGEATARFNLEQVKVRLDPLLPPILTSCATPGALELQVGDLGLKVDFDLGGGPGSLEFFGTLRVEVLPVLVGAAGQRQLSLELGAVHDLAFDVVHAEGTGAGLTTLVETLLADVVRNLVLETLVKDALTAWPIPVLDLGAYVPGLPAGSKVTFEPQTLAPLEHGNLLLGGKVVAP